MNDLYLIFQNRQMYHCVKSVRVRSYSGPHFLAFGLNTETKYVFSAHVGKCGPEQLRI